VGAVHKGIVNLLLTHQPSQAMSLLSGIFKPKKKKFLAKCTLSGEPVEPGDGFLLTTAQVIASKKYWDGKMTEPETMAYTISYFKHNDTMAARMRQMIFEKFSTMEKPWLISDSYIQLFEVDKRQAKELAQKWWESEGQFIPDNSGPASERMSEERFLQIQEYAVRQAGSQRISA
jgi:hypothetical protein